MSKRLLAALVLTLFLLPVFSVAEDQHKLQQPTLTPQQSGTTNSLIAVSPVNRRVVWASGRNGTFVVTTDGGETWRAGVVPGAESLQFRDVEGVSAKVAYLLSIGNGPDSRIYKTTDGGETWTLLFQNQDPNAFYDCFAFWTRRRGLAHSDPVNGRFPDLRTRNGVTWEDIGDNLPPALPGEFSFASSGTCVETQGKRRAWIATGGAAPWGRILATTDRGETWNAYVTPLRGSPTAGVFSVDFRNRWRGFIGGGDLDPTAAPFPQTARTRDGGRTWKLTPSQPGIGTVFGVSYVQGDGNRKGGDHHYGRYYYSRYYRDDDHDGDGYHRGHDRDDDDDRDGDGWGRFEPRGHRHAVVVTGPDGAAWTPNEGNIWFTLPGVTGFWGVAFASPKAGWLVGTDGRILKISFERQR